jgi:hypothetical protein
MTRRPGGPSTVVRVGAALAVIALLAGLVLTFVGGTRSGTTTTTTGPTTSAPGNLSDADYGRAIAAVDAIITAAGADRCELSVAFDQVGTLAPPTNPTQAKAAAQVTAELLGAAATVAGDDATTAQALRDAGAALLTEGEQKAWDPAFLTTAPGAAALNTPAFLAAVRTYRAKDKEACGGASTTTGP